MMYKKILSLLSIIALIFIIVACEKQTDQPPIDDGKYPPDSYTLDEKLNWWLEKLTLEEKAGQMIQAERKNGSNGVTPAEVKSLNLGSVLNGGGNVPNPNTLSNWQNMAKTMYNAALESSSGIPLIYGVDAVHGHNNLQGATIFPHNIGLAATNNPDLMREIGKYTAYEVSQTFINMNFSPSIGIIKDKRWGRTYETLGESSELAQGLIGPYIEGIQEYGVIGSAKHFLADGYTTYGTGLNGKLDRGNSEVTGFELYEYFIPLYVEAIEADVKTIMVSYSSLNGIKMHENKELVTEVLKEDLGFEGFVIGDYNGIDELNASTFEGKVARAINAGIDMLMQPHNYKQVYDAIIYNVNNEKIPMERIDDAVRRILKVKYEMGLFDKVLEAKNDLRSEEALAVARQAVRESMVLLKNENNALPLSKSDDILLLGVGSDNLGIQSGGWTISWQGGDNINVTGTTIYEAIKAETSGSVYRSISDLDKVDKVVVVLAEKPHAEMNGDSSTLSLTSDTAYTENLEVLEMIKDIDKPVIVLLIAGKPLLIEEFIDEVDSFVMLFLPGSEGLGITDVLYGAYDFKGKLPFTWPKTVNQSNHTLYKENYNELEYRYPFGYGLRYNS